jgi:hypothetical protein
LFAAREFHAAISVPEGSENVAEKIFFGNAKRGLPRTQILREAERAAVARSPCEDARLARHTLDFYICASSALCLPDAPERNSIEDSDQNLHK